MINIGIDKNTGLLYELDGGIGRPVWPTPVITPAKFVFSSKEDVVAHESGNRFGYRFREDSYDPIARIRRGRFYKAGDQQPMQMLVAHHPGNPIAAIARDIHANNAMLETFYGNPIYYQYIQKQNEMPIVLLGAGDRFTSWAIVDVEAIESGEDLVTLKARSNFGVLPEFKDHAVTSDFSLRLRESIDYLRDEIHRSSPVSVIDRARDTATIALLAYFDLRNEHAKDLGDLVNKLRDEKKYIACDCGNIIAKLHARAKPNEQEKRALPKIREQDADLAVQCIGTLLCELGFAVWR